MYVCMYEKKFNEKPRLVLFMNNIYILSLSVLYVSLAIDFFFFKEKKGVFIFPKVHSKKNLFIKIVKPP